MNPSADPNSFAERLNFIPPCLRVDKATGAPPSASSLDSCVYQSILYYIELLLVIVAIAAFFYIIYAGIQMATAYGNEGKYTQAKGTVTNAIIGIIVATLAYGIVGFFTNILGVDSRFQFIDQGTGQQTVNNESVVTGLYQVRALATQPNDGPLTDEEYNFIKNNGVDGKELTTSGTNVGLYLLNSAEFQAELIKSDGSVVITSVGRRGDEYYARLWGSASSFQGATLKIYQRDKDGVEHYKEIKIK